MRNFSFYFCHNVFKSLLLQERPKSFVCVKGLTKLVYYLNISAAKNLIACGVQTGRIVSNYKLYGHRDAGNTDCPGDALYALIQTWPKYSHTHP